MAKVAKKTENIIPFGTFFSCQYHFLFLWPVTVLLLRTFCLQTEAVSLAGKGLQLLLKKLSCLSGLVVVSADWVIMHSWWSCLCVASFLLRHCRFVLCKDITSESRIIKLAWSYAERRLSSKWRGVSPRPSLGTVLDSLPSHASSYLTLLFNCLYIFFSQSIDFNIWYIAICPMHK